MRGRVTSLAMRSACSRRFYSSSAIKKVTVIGGGLMGSGIAQVSAQNGFRVTVVDQSQEALDKGVAGIQKSLTRVAKKKFAEQEAEAEQFVRGVVERISVETDAKKAVSDADLVVEAIVENLEVKQQLFRDLDEAAPQHTILATNTSSLSVADICNGARPDRFGGLHFFSPVPMMRLVEVIATDETSQETTDALVQFGKDVGKTVVQAKDTPGFIVNRLLLPLLVEATEMVNRGDATKEDVDLAMRLGCGHPMGPLALSDAVGLDTIHHILSAWSKRYPDEAAFRLPPNLDELVKQGKYGVKTGEGFYSYKKK